MKLDLTKSTFTAEEAAELQNMGYLMVEITTSSDCHPIFAIGAHPEPSHPMQPIVTDKSGVIRFYENPIIGWLCREVTDLDKIAVWCDENGIDDKHQAQLAQLIGCSVSAWGGLSYVSEKDCAIADEKAAELIYSNEETK